MHEFSIEVVSWSEGASLFFFLVGVGYPFSNGCFGVECGLAIVHFPLGEWTITFPFMQFLFFIFLGGRGGQSKEFPSS
jgi:hypothetical protein